VGILFKKVFLHKLIMMSNFNEINLNKQLQNAIDNWTHFSEDCNYVTSIEEYTTSKEFLKVTGLL